VNNSAGPEFNNVQVNAVSVTDYMAGTGTMRGHRVSTHPGGDKTFLTFDGMTKTVMSANGSPKTTFEGKWWYIGGTVAFNEITDEGTYKRGTKNHAR
jgi:hypothetical protein